MNLNLKPKIAIVTAASQGLGKAAATSLAQEGAIVVICSRKKKAIERTANEIHKLTDADVIPFVADVSKLADIKKLIAFTKKQFGTIHILVNNAGGPPTGDILSISETEWEKGIELTLKSMIRLTREVLPFMIKQSWGRIITITSIAGKQPINDLLISSTLRPGIHGLTKVLSNKFAKEKIGSLIRYIFSGALIPRIENPLARTVFVARQSAMRAAVIFKSSPITRCSW